MWRVWVRTDKAFQVAKLAVCIDGREFRRSHALLLDERGITGANFVAVQSLKSKDKEVF